MDELLFLLLIVTAVVSSALLLTYLVDSKITDGENDRATPPAEKTVNNNRAEEKISGNSLKQDATNDGGWKCACEGGGIFLPPSLMRSVGGPSAFMRAGTGNCYHKQM